jgi:hypothetical protein
MAPRRAYGAPIILDLGALAPGQLGNVRRDPSRLVSRKKFSRRPLPRLILEINICEFLAAVVADDEACASLGSHVFDPRQIHLIQLYLRLATSTYREVEMSCLTASVRLIVALMLLSIGFVLYPQGSANAAKYCAELRGATATGHPDCSYTSHSACRKAVRAGGGGHCYKLRH